VENVIILFRNPLFHAKLLCKRPPRAAVSNSGEKYAKSACIDEEGRHASV